MICSDNAPNEAQTRCGDKAEKWTRDIVIDEIYRVKDERSGAKDARERTVTGAVKGGTSHLHEAAAADEITSLCCMYIYVNQSRRLPNHPHHRATLMNHTTMRCKHCGLKTSFSYSVVSGER